MARPFATRRRTCPGLCVTSVQAAVKPPTQAPVQALLFDLGGVIVNTSADTMLRAWAAYSRLSFDQLKAAFTGDQPYQQFERGEIAAAQFYDHLAQTLQLNASHAQIEAGWNAIFLGEISPTVQRIQALRTRFGAKLPLYAFSNTNAVHKKAWPATCPNVNTLFDQIFTSHALGLRKPELAAYNQVVQNIGLPAASILFFDDSHANVDAALAAGLQAVRVNGPADVEQALQQVGL